MDLKSHFSDKLDKFIFLKIKSEEAYLPVESSSIIDKIKAEGGLEKIPFAYFLQGMFFMLGIDDNFKYADDYKKIIAKTKGSIEYIKGEIAEKIKEEKYEEGYVLLKGLSKIEKSHDVYSKMILLLETIRSNEPAFKEEEIAIVNEAKDIEGCFEAYYYDAVLKEEKRDYRGALESIKKYIELSNDNSKEIIEFKDSLAKSADYEEAKEILFDNPKKALKLLVPLKDEFPDDAALLYYVGVCFRVLGNFEKSIYYLKQALELDNNLVQAANELGISYASLGEFETAEAYFRKAFEVTKSAEICTNLVMCYLNMGKRKDAELHLKIAEKLAPDDEIVISLKKHMEQN